MDKGEIMDNIRSGGENSAATNSSNLMDMIGTLLFLERTVAYKSSSNQAFHILG
jgi:hypothetical protein